MERSRLLEINSHLFKASKLTSNKLLLVAMLLAGLSVRPMLAQGPELTAPPAEIRIASPIDETKLFQLKGNTHPGARPEFDRGQVDASLPMDRMLLVLKRSPAQEAALEKFMTEQSDPHSPNFHHWLKPEEFGALYGPSPTDIKTITSWLQNHGFTINQVTNGRLFVEFSGTAALVKQTFHTEIHRYMVHGEEHISNNVDPSIPQALTPVVEGISSLNDFFPKPMHRYLGGMHRSGKSGKWTPVEPNLAVQPLFNTPTADSGFELVAPYDFATIYNVLPLWNAGLDGTGQSIAIAGRTDISLTDVAAFRSAFGLPANPPQIIYNGADPGTNADDRVENTLDVEWSGAVAKGAAIRFVTTANTATAGGVFASAEFIIDHNVAPVMSYSFGACELVLGTATNAAINNLWQQGAADGITIFVSSGDQGSAACDTGDSNEAVASEGLQVSGSSSTPYDVAVGGTDFDWVNLSANYWNASNSATGESAVSYIPEIPWNGTCASPSVDQYVGGTQLGYDAEETCQALIDNGIGLNLVSVSGGTGGVSACTTPSGTTPATCAGGYAKPSWQQGVGVPSDGKRDVPDVSLFAASGALQDAYVICDSYTTPCTFTDANDVLAQAVGGTSVASPAMAGIMAIVNQKMGTPQGFANPALYALAAKDNRGSCNSMSVGAGNSCNFYDITTDTNAVPCLPNSTNCTVIHSGDEIGILTGYNSTTGYDLTTGLGSVNATNLVNNWSSVTKSAPGTQLSPTSLNFGSVNLGSTSAQQAITLTNSGNATLNISSIAIGGANPSSFLIASRTCGSTLAPSANCTISVDFVPGAAAALTGAVVVTDNAPGSPQSVPLSGTGVQSTGSFSQIGGSLTQISVGADGTIWGLNGAQQIFSYNQSIGQWTNIPGALVQIAVGSGSAVWGLNAQQQVLRYDFSNNTWQFIPGALVVIAVGGDGDVWGLNAQANIYHFNPQTQAWNQIPGQLIHISVGSAGATYGLNSAGQIFWYNPGSASFQYVPGTAGFTQVSAGVDGTLWGLAGGVPYEYSALQNRMIAGPGSLTQIVVGSATSVFGLNGAGSIYRWSPQSSNWVQIPGTLSTIAAGANGALWGLNSQESIYELEGEVTQPYQTLSAVAGTLNQVSVGADGSVWGLTSGVVQHYHPGIQSFEPVPGAPALSQLSVGAAGDVWGVNASGSVYQYEAASGTWNNIPGVLSVVQVAADGAVWGLNSAGSVFTYNFANANWIAIPGQLASISVGADGTVWGINSVLQVVRFNAATQSWVPIPGALSQISVGSANNVWGINPAQQVYQYNSAAQAWTYIPNALLTEVWTTFDGAVWGVNSAGGLFRWNPTNQSFEFVGNGITSVVAGNAASVWAINASTGGVYSWF